VSDEHKQLLEKLRAEFVREFSSELGRLEPVLEASRNGLQSRAEAVAAAGEFFHRLAGVAETFGLTTLGRLASVCDRIADLAKGSHTPKEQDQFFEIMCIGAGATHDSFIELDVTAAAPQTMVFPAPRRVITSPLFESGRAATIAIVDDDATSGQIITACLESTGYQTTLIRDPRVAAENLARSLPDLILLDVAMPELDGFALCEILRRNSALALVPILFVTAKNDTTQKVRGLTVGGNDYIEKPFVPDELVARVAAHLERLRTIRELAIRDSLTGVFNHKYVEGLIDQEVKRAERYVAPLSFAIVDIDHFKTINDTHGHQTGDAVLSRVVRHISGQLRTSDSVGRWGGDEFVVLLTETPLDAAEGVMRRVGVSVRNASQGEVQVTASIGVAGLRPGDSMASIIERADKALYQAKKSGRNQVAREG
jgi:diguanylate cyclase (GGDEF)-like protein